MDYKCLKLEKHDDQVSLVTLNRPEKLNSLNPQLMLEIEQVSQELSKDANTRVVIFTGAGKHFCGGVDLSDLPEPKTVLENLRRLESGPVMIEKINKMNPITIAAINGGAYGGGACIAAACDFRIGAENCKVGFPESKLGMNLSWRALPLVLRLIGPANAKEMVILGKGYNAETLLKWGFISKTVPNGNLLDSAFEMAHEYARMPPIPAQMIKKSINRLSSAMDDSIMHMDSDQWLLTAGTKDFTEGISAFFEKREATFKGD
jgi:enoyl-CoA hydratase/carnithine racemase